MLESLCLILNIHIQISHTRAAVQFHLVTLLRNSIANNSSRLDRFSADFRLQQYHLFSAKEHHTSNTSYTNHTYLFVQLRIRIQLTHSLFNLCSRSHQTFISSYLFAFFSFSFVLAFSFLTSPIKSIIAETGQFINVRQSVGNN